MESAINFLPKPKIVTKSLKYINNSQKVYANLYQIKILKVLNIYQYPFTVIPEIAPGDSKIRNYLFKNCSQLKNIYGECLISGDSLFGLKKVDESKIMNSFLSIKGKKEEYTLTFQKVANERTIRQEDIQRDPLTKQFIELLIKDILYSNPKLEFYKGFFVINTDKKTIETDKFSINFYPGFTTSFMETDSGNYLNVTLKNKIIQSDTVQIIYFNTNMKINQIKIILKSNLLAVDLKFLMLKEITI